MSRSHWILVLLAFLVVSGWAAYYAIQPAAYPGLACSGERVVTFGWTHIHKTKAELAAIVRWQQIAEQQSPAYKEWHNARNRYLKCRRIGGPKGQYQCKVAALPCRIADASAVR